MNVCDNYDKVFETQLNRLILCSHPCVVHLYGFVLPTPEKPQFSIFTSFSDSSLADVIRDRPPWLNKTAMTIIIIGILAGMKHIHEQHVIHGNLKPDSILLNEAHYPAISNFGPMDKVGLEDCYCTEWTAPEVVMGTGYDEKSDVYSFGVILYQLVSGKCTLRRMTGGNILEGKRPLIPSTVNKLWCNIIEKCWSTNPEDRPSFSAVLAELQKTQFATNGDFDVESFLQFLSYADLKKSFYATPSRSFRVMEDAVIGYLGENNLVGIPESSHGNVIAYLGPRLLYNSTHIYSVFVPSGIETIGDECFYQSESLVTVEFSSDSHLKCIGPYAFYESGLKSIRFPSSLEVIGDKCFCRCASLLNVELALDSQLKSIGDSAFRECGIKSVQLPFGVEHIGGACFSLCHLDLAIDANNQHFCVHKGLLMSYDRKRLICSYQNASFDIPYTIETIDDCCFEHCSSLVSIEISSDSHLESIGNRAFYGSGLHSIYLPSSLESIGDECFCYCSSLITVEFSSDSHLKSIGQNAFAYSALKSICLPSNLESISDECFSGCKSLVSVEFTCDSHLKSIGSRCFHESGLERICIPSSVEIIGIGCFIGCKSLSFEVSPDSQLGRFRHSVFRESGIQHVWVPSCIESIGDRCFYECKSLVSVEFTCDSHLKSIGREAFYNSGLHSICIPSNLESIDDECFRECKSLVSVEFSSESHLKSIGRDAFTDCSTLSTVRIPVGFQFRSSIPENVEIVVGEGEGEENHIENVEIVVGEGEGEGNHIED